MRRIIVTAFLIFAFVSAAFAGSISPTEVEWDTSKGDLAFTVTDATDIVSYEDAVKLGTKPLYFTFSGGKGDFGKEDYKYTSPKLTIYADALKKMNNATYNLTVTTTNTVTKDVTVTDEAITIDLTAEGFAGVGAVVFEEGKIQFDPSEFSFVNGVLTIAKGKVAKGDYAATVYEGLPVTLTVSCNPEKQTEEEKQEEKKQEEEQEEKKNSGGSRSGGGGCNAGFGMIALLFAAPLFCRKKK